MPESSVAKRFEIAAHVAVELQREDSAAAVWLEGPLAVGLAHAHSDIDLRVVTPQPRDGRKSGHDLAPLLHKVAHKNASGYAGGAGITLFPDELKDLLYWEFGEDKYVRGGAERRLGPTGSKLAAPGRPYQDKDGLSESGPPRGNSPTTARSSSTGGTARQ